MPNLSIEPCLLSISDRYRGFISDAFGVFWSGSQIYPGALATFETLMKRGSPVIIVSNSTVLGAKEKAKYAQHGLHQQVHYHELITSGDLTRSLFMDPTALPWALGKRYWVWGGTHPQVGAPHQKIFDGTSFEEVAAIEQADFIYLAIPHLDGQDQTDPERFRQGLKEVVSRGLPALCANPDRFAQHGAPHRFVVRQGSIAQLYEELGGKVLYLGKPGKEIFQFALKEMESQGVDRSEVVMVGDNVETDIAGAHRSKIASALVMETGVAGQQASGSWEAFARSLSAPCTPTHWIERLAIDPDQGETKNRSTEKPSTEKPSTEKPSTLEQA